MLKFQHLGPNMTQPERKTDKRQFYALEPGRALVKRKDTCMTGFPEVQQGCKLHFIMAMASSKPTRQAASGFCAG